MRDEPASEDRQLRADRLKERIYITFALLAVVLATLSHTPVHADVALRTVAVTAIATGLAVFVADVISHLVVHEAAPTRREFAHITAVVSGGLSAAVVPVGLLVAANLTALSAETALHASTYVLVGTLIVIGIAAVRRTGLTWWQRLIALGGEAVIGLVVIGLQVLAKSH